MCLQIAQLKNEKSQEPDKGYSTCDITLTTKMLELRLRVALTESEVLYFSERPNYSIYQSVLLFLKLS